MIFETTTHYLKWLVMLLLENTVRVRTTILLYKAVQSASRYLYVKRNNELLFSLFWLL